MFKFSSKYNLTEISRKKFLSALGFDPTTFRLVSSCLGITFLSCLCNSTLPILETQYCRALAEAMKTTTVVTGSITRSLYIFLSRCVTASLTNLSYQFLLTREICPLEIVTVPLIDEKLLQGDLDVQVSNVRSESRLHVEEGDVHLRLSEAHPLKVSGFQLFLLP